MHNYLTKAHHYKYQCSTSSSITELLSSAIVSGCCQLPRSSVKSKLQDAFQFFLSAVKVFHIFNLLWPDSYWSRPNQTFSSWKKSSKTLEMEKMALVGADKVRKDTQTPLWHAFFFTICEASETSIAARIDVAQYIWSLIVYAWCSNNTSLDLE